MNNLSNSTEAPKFSPPTSPPLSPKEGSPNSPKKLNGRSKSFIGNASIKFFIPKKSSTIGRADSLRLKAGAVEEQDQPIEQRGLQSRRRISALFEKSPVPAPTQEASESDEESSDVEQDDNTFSSTVIKDDNTFSSTVIKDDNTFSSTVIKDDTTFSSTVIKKNSKPVETAKGKTENKVELVRKEMDPKSYLALAMAASEKRREDLIEKRNQASQKKAILDLNDKWAAENTPNFIEQKKWVESGAIYTKIAEIRQFLNEIVSFWSLPIFQSQQQPFNAATESLYNKLKAKIVNLVIKESDFKKGMGGVYRGNGFAVKVKGEGVCELNNNRYHASVYREPQVRDHIPPYQDNEREVCCYEIACHLGLPEITPPAILAIIENRNDLISLQDNDGNEIKKMPFSDIEDRLGGAELQNMQEKAGKVDLRKLCTVIEWVENGYDVEDTLKEWATETLKDSKGLSQDAKEKALQECIAQRIDFDDFEDCNIFIQAIGDTDANLGNFLLYLKDPQKGIYGIKKIDNACALPEKNAQFLNGLMRFTVLAASPMSVEAKEAIMAIKPASYAQAIKGYFLGDKVLQATKQRIETMQAIIEKYPGITHLEMNFRLSLLGIEGENPLRLINKAELSGIEPALSSSKVSKSRLQVTGSEVKLREFKLPQMPMEGEESRAKQMATKVIRFMKACAAFVWSWVSPPIVWTFRQIKWLVVGEDRTPILPI